MKNLGFGLMRLPLQDMADQKSIDYEILNQMVDLFMEKGFTYFDTGYPYHMGMSEVAFREAVVKRYPRDCFTITDKMPLMNIKEAKQYPEIFAEQLERCGVDYFDYYLLHALGQRNYGAVQEMDGFGFLSKLKAEGKIRHIGFSYHDNAEFLNQVLTEHPEIELVQLQINYADWDDIAIQSGKCYEVCRKHGKKVIVMEPLKGGILAQLPQEAADLLKKEQPNMSVASWGIRFAASLENVMMVLSGMSDVEQMQDNLGYMEQFKPLDKSEQELLQTVNSILKKETAVPCTGCRYCVNGCPKNIMIPEVFAIYNDFQRHGPRGGAMMRYMDLISVSGKPKDCVACKQCEKNCPQHLPIMEYLKKVKEAVSFLE